MPVQHSHTRTSSASLSQQSSHTECGAGFLDLKPEETNDLTVGGPGCIFGGGKADFFEGTFLGGAGPISIFTEDLAKFFFACSCFFLFAEPARGISDQQISITGDSFTSCHESGELPCISLTNYNEL
jgi:hypothetical protein